MLPIIEPTVAKQHDLVHFRGALHNLKVLHVHVLVTIVPCIVRSEHLASVAL